MLSTLNSSAVSSAVSSRVNHAPAPMTSRERQVLTSAKLKECGLLQMQILEAAMESSQLIELWAAKLLHRHWTSVVRREVAKNGKPQAGARWKWNFDVARMRTADLYQSGGLEVAPTNNLKLSARALHLEAWYFRYLLVAFPDTERRDHVVDSMIKKIVPGDTELAKEHHTCLKGHIIEGIKNELAEASNFLGKYAEEFLVPGESELARNQRTRLKELVLEGMKNKQAEGTGLAPKYAEEYRKLGVPSQLHKALTEQKWTRAVIAMGMYELMHWDYISTLPDLAGNQPARKRKMEQLVRKVLQLTNDVIELNRPIQVKVARSLLARREPSTITISDLLQTCARSAYRAASQFNYLFGHTFAGIAKYTMQCQLRREIGDHRTIHLPENMAQALVKHRGWAQSHPDLVDRPIEEQLALADVKMSPFEFHEARVIEETTHSESLQELVIDEESELADRITTDKGQGAEEIRDKDTDPFAMLLQRGIEKLDPLQKAVLSCLVPCKAMDGAELAWLDRVIELGRAQIAAASSNVNRSVVTHVASSLSVFYNGTV